MEAFTVRLYTVRLYTVRLYTVRLYTVRLCTEEHDKMAVDLPRSPSTHRSVF